MASGTLSPPPVGSSSGSSGKARVKALAPAERDRFIETQISRTRAYVKSVDIAYGVLVLVTGLIAYLLVMAVVDHWIVPKGLGWFGRTLTFLILFGAAGWHLVKTVAPLFLRSINPLYAAHTIEQVQPSFKNSLMNLLQLRQNRGVVSSAVYDSVEEHAATRLAQVPIEAAVDRAPLIRLGYVMFGVVLAAAFYLVLSPKSTLQSAARVLAPWADIAAPTRVEIRDVRPGDAAVVRGTQLEVSAEIRGLGDEEEAHIVFRTANGDGPERAIPLFLSEGAYRHTAKLPPGDERFQQDVIYHLEAGDARSPEFRVAVEPTPMIEVVSVEYDFLAYTEPVLLDKKVEQAGDIRGHEGTKVTIQAKANQAIARAWVDFDCDGKMDDAMNVRGDRAAISFTLSFKDRAAQIPWRTSYQLKFHNPGGRDNPQPVHHAIEVLPDLAPEVQLILPAAAMIEAAEDEEVEFHASARDADFKLSDVFFWYDGKTGQVKPASEPLLASDKAPWQGQFEARWKRTPGNMGFRAGEVISYWVEAVDNHSPLVDANRVSTKKQTIRVLPPKNPPQSKKNDPSKSKDPPPEKQPEKNPDKKNDTDQKKDEENPAQEKPMQGDQPMKGDRENEAEEKQPGEQEKEGSKKNDSGDGMQEGMQGGEQNGEKNGNKNKQGNRPNDEGGMNGGQNDGASGKGMNGGKDGSKKGMPGQAGNMAETEQAPGDGSTATSNDPSQGGNPTTRDIGNAGEQPPRPADNEQAIKELLDDAKKSGKPEPGAKGKPEGANGTPGENTPGAADKATMPEMGDTGNNMPPGNQEGTGGMGKMPGDAKMPGEGGNDGSDPTKPMEMPGEGGMKEGDPAKPEQDPGDGMGETPQLGKTDEPQDGGAPPKPEGHEKKPSDPQPNQKSPTGGMGDRGAAKSGGKASDSDTGSPAPHGKNKEQTQDEEEKTADTKKSDEGDDAKSPTTSDKKSRKPTKGETKGDRSSQGSKGGGEGTKQQGNDKDGTTTPSDSGSGPAEEPGEGETGTNGGDDKEANGEKGKAGNKRGDGSSTRKAETPPSGAEKGKPGDGMNPNGDKSDAPPEKEHGEKDGTAGDKPGDGSQIKPGAGTGTNNPKPAEQPHEQTIEKEDPADLEYAKQATDLALDHLRDRMKQGNEKELLDKLGWTREDAEQFLANWDKIKADAQRPGAKADAQKNLNDELKSLGLRSSSAKVNASDVKKDAERKLNQGVNIPTPPEFRDRQRAYRAGTGKRD